ncbi:MAG: DUF2752 domain-containing protein, partial [Verrucomicrobiota bacterium]
MTASRHPGVIVAPLVTFFAVVLLLIVAHHYENLPAQLPECGFKSLTGVPCAGCGGTRSMQALSSGKIGAAVSFHPLFALSALAAPLWLAFGIRGYLMHSQMPSAVVQNRRLIRGVIVYLALLLLNWFYLIFFLP